VVDGRGQGGEQFEAQRPVLEPVRELPPATGSASPGAAFQDCRVGENGGVVRAGPFVCARRIEVGRRGLARRSAGVRLRARRPPTRNVSDACARSALSRTAGTVPMALLAAVVATSRAREPTNSRYCPIGRRRWPGRRPTAERSRRPAPTAGRWRRGRAGTPPPRRPGPSRATTCGPPDRSPRWRSDRTPPRAEHHPGRLAADQVGDGRAGRADDLPGPAGGLVRAAPVRHRRADHPIAAITGSAGRVVPPRRSARSPW
jgi:hypothetical protein